MLYKQIKIILIKKLNFLIVRLIGKIENKQKSFNQILSIFTDFITDIFFQDNGNTSSTETRTVECEGTLQSGKVEFHSPGFPNNDNSSRSCNLKINPETNSCAVK